MTKILKLQKLQKQCPVNELRKSSDHISSHVQSLLTLGIRIEHCGPLVVSIMLEKLPNEMPLVISRKLEKNNCVRMIFQKFQNMKLQLEKILTF